jgi:hypothetical protein
MKARRSTVLRPEMVASPGASPKCSGQKADELSQIARVGLDRQRRGAPLAGKMRQPAARGGGEIGARRREGKGRRFDRGRFVGHDRHCRRSCLMLSCRASAISRPP